MQYDPEFLLVKIFDKNEKIQYTDDRTVWQGVFYFSS